MGSDQYHRDLTDVINLLFGGRIDLRLFQDIPDAGDGLPGLQRAVKNWVRRWLHDGVMTQNIDLNSMDINNINNADIAGTLDVHTNINLNHSDINNIDNIDERIYYVSTDAELDNAISDITTNQCAGKIIITNSISNVQVTINALNSSFVIESNGDEIILDPNGDNSVFGITNCLSCVIKDIKIDISDFTVAGSIGISINETSDNPITIERVTISGDSVNGIGIKTQSKNTSIINCKISNLKYGLWAEGVEDVIMCGNTIRNCSADCINLQNCSDSIIDHNILKTNGADGIDCSGGDWNIISNNTVHGAVTGISLDGNACRNNLLGNSVSSTGNEIEIGGGSDENIVVANQATVVDGGANNIVANNNNV